MWIIENILASMPPHVWPLSAAACLGVYIVSKILRDLPFTGVISSAAILAGVFSVFMWGGSGVSLIYQEQIKEAEAKIAVAEAESQELNTRLEKALRDKNKALQAAKEALASQIDQIAAQIDAECKVDPEAIKTLNEFATKGKK